MTDITADLSLQALAALISQTLESHGIVATLSGGAAVSIHTDNRYLSRDLDFVSAAGAAELARVVLGLGFVATTSQRLFSHPCSPWLLEFPAGPLGFGHMVVDASELEALSTPFGPLRVITPTLCVMDRLAAFLHWRDRQCYEQATWMAHDHPINWEEVQRWA